MEKVKHPLTALIKPLAFLNRLIAGAKQLNYTLEYRTEVIQY